MHRTTWYYVGAIRNILLCKPEKVASREMQKQAIVFPAN